MLYDSLSFLAEQVNNYFKTTDGNSSISADFTQLKNIAQIPEDKLAGLNHVFLTLVNISEELTLKNQPNLVRPGDGAIYRNAPINLNLYVLFTCVNDSYPKALQYLSHIIKFFQGTNTFTKDNGPVIKNGQDNFRMMLELYPLTFEQANGLWSTLGGKQHPHILYRVRLVELLRNDGTEGRAVIKKIDLKEKLR